MAVEPDIYADGFSITAGPFGVAVTLQLSEPPNTPGPAQAVSVDVARIRMSRELARVLCEQLTQLLAQSAQSPTQVSSGVKH